MYRAINIIVVDNIITVITIKNRALNRNYFTMQLHYIISYYIIINYIILSYQILLYIISYQTLFSQYYLHE